MKNSTWLTIAILAIAGFGFYYFASNKTQTDQLKFIRNNWSVYITRPDVKYKYNQLGGIYPFDVPVENNSDYLLDEVIVTVDYIKTDGGVYKTENVTINNIPPHSKKFGRAPESPRGTSIDVKITEVISRSLHLCYPSGAGDYADPYFCH